MNATNTPDEGSSGTHRSDGFSQLVSQPARENVAHEDLVVDMQDVSVVRNRKTILYPLDWRVELDERWIVLGPNGAGKTTLMKLASAQEFPTTGTIELIGQRMGRVDLRSIRNSIGVSSSAVAARVPDDETVADIVISAGYDILGRWREDYGQEDRDQAIETLERLSAYHLADDQWGTLSEGERKRVLISRALMTDPELLLLDEPGAGLDLGGREDLVYLLGQLAMDPTAPAMVMVTHHVEEIPEGFTHAMLLSEGHVIAQGLIDDVMTSENLTATYRQPIDLRYEDGRYSARRTRISGSHRNR